MAAGLEIAVPVQPCRWLLRANRIVAWAKGREASGAPSQGQNGQER